MNLKSILIVLLVSAGNLAAQGPATWEPAVPFVGDSILITFDPAKSSAIPDNATSLVLHWGVNETSAGAWDPPPQDLWPAGTVLHSDNIAARSPMTKNGAVWQVKLATDDRLETIHFVFNTGTPAAPGGSWDNNGGKNWNITLRQQTIKAVFVTPLSNNAYGDLRRSPAFLPDGGELACVGTAAINEVPLDSLILMIAGEVVEATAQDTLRYTIDADGYEPGFKDLQLVAVDTDGIRDTTSTLLMVNPPMQDLAVPEGVAEGIHYPDAQRAVLTLYAPYKSFVYVIGDFNDWMVDEGFYMNRDVIDADSVRWWIQLDNLMPGEEYAFQYLVDGEIRIADPYTRKVLDPWHDSEIIQKGFYPGLKPYPSGKTSEPVAVLQTVQTPYVWQSEETYQRPAQTELVIYELLVRDFLEQHTYKTLIDTLDYLERLGITAIELMPVNEFEGNSSWGYNPSFYFAPDKFYGPAEDLKAFIDACHQRNIAVIIDMVLNHSFGQSPLVRLYSTDNGYPSTQNPWYYADVNPNFAGYQARHPYNVGYDFNHGSEKTKELVDRINTYWLEEFKVDGFRFDLTKGLTNRNTYQYSYFDQNNNIIDVYNEGATSNYDAFRISVLKRMADTIWGVDSTAFVILEHFCDNTEEKELAAYRQGMMLWGNTNYNYNEATMGYNESGKSDFSWGYYENRGWTKPNLVTYMESHDEERLMFKNLEYGNSSGSYNVQDPETALNRMKLAGAFFFTYPGPKMLWQFGELGYDASINDPCRLCEKDPVWNYYQEELRQKLYKTWAALINLRKTVPAFTSPDANVELSVGGAAKRIRISHTSMNVIIIGNFDVVSRDIVPNFFYSGTWYDYFSGAAVDISDGSAAVTLKPGEFHIYTSKKLPAPEEDILNSVPEKRDEIPAVFALGQNYPNPFNPVTTIGFELAERSDVRIVIYDILGREVTTLLRGIRSAGRHTVVWDGTDAGGLKVGSGIYIYRIRAAAGRAGVYEEQRKMILLK